MITMKFLLDHPVIFLLVLLIVLGSATRLGVAMRIRHGTLEGTRRSDFDIVLGATLTLLSLIVGFSFSMAASRYDLRKNYEEGEANAIGTAYARADLLPAVDAARVKQLLHEYTRLRLNFYTITSYTLGAEKRLSELNRTTNAMQAQLWAAVVAPVKANQTAPMMLVAGAMNDALNSQGYAQAASWNRIPPGAWVLLCTIGLVATIMIGFRFDTGSRQRMLMQILPALIAISLFLISDIDCPRGGIIRVLPQNLMALEAALG
jgi:hypothetical protein